MTETPHIPVSWGELLDKISILEIKAARIAAPAALANVRAELSLLAAVARPALDAHPATVPVLGALKNVNETLWDIEDRIREHERDGDFGAGFIELARAVYRTNDERGRLKRRLNELLGSALVEEKHYSAY
jgi:hypothetical protein